MDDIKKDLSLLLRKGNLGNYQFAKVDQIVLLVDKRIINYFTNVTVSSEFTKEEPFHYLTDSPKTVKDRIQVAISSYTINIKQAKALFAQASQSGQWDFNNHTVIIDSPFTSHRKFVPDNDPAVSQYNCFVPLEWYLYGSNCIGNYHIIEIFSKKEIIHEKLKKSDYDKIQTVIKACKLPYKLNEMSDRIGNMICKIKVESFKYKPTALGYEHGIGLEFSYTKTIAKHGLTLSVVQEHDGLIYTNDTKHDFKDKILSLPSNQWKTQISITDNKTGLILYMGIFDYKSYSGYYSQINLQNTVIILPEKRVLHFQDYDEEVELSGVSQAGSYYEFVEMAMATERKKRHEDTWFEECGYFKSYSTGQHQDALKDIISIINANSLLWDLKEVCIIDPYLTSKELAKTAFYCKKPNIHIKALCSYSTIKNNKNTSSTINSSDITAFIKNERRYINSVLGDATDICLEYRTVFDGHGLKFHDRYIILTFDLNKCRAWMLGSSLNSIGDAHSVIQIVEAPNKILELFEQQWNATSCEKCIIFDNTNKTGQTER